MIIIETDHYSNFIRGSRRQPFSFVFASAAAVAVPIPATAAAIIHFFLLFSILFFSFFPRYEALLEVYHACGGSGWHSNKGWSLALRELSTWAGLSLKKQPSATAAAAAVSSAAVAAGSSSSFDMPFALLVSKQWWYSQTAFFDQ